MSKLDQENAYRIEKGLPVLELKEQVCTTCKEPKHERDAKYCFNCGTKLS